MSYACLRTACISAAKVVPITVEVDVQPGLPVFSIIGLPDKGLEEARQRVRSAIRNSGYPFPLGRVTVNLSPSQLRKQGASFDLPIALGILAATRVVPCPPSDVWVLGELGLEGELRPTSRLVAILIGALRRRIKCFIPDQEERNLVPEVSACVVRNLTEAAKACTNGPVFRSHAKPKDKRAKVAAYAIDQVQGQAAAKRALQIALAGGHNLLMAGPPGNGKSMLAKSAIQLLPEPSREESLEMIGIRSMADLSLISVRRPFREPHHMLSAPALLGGGISSRPGELALAHKGILFLDEFPEFPRETLESLRQPMQDKEIRLSKRGTELVYPADCVVLAAQNYCPCGLTGSGGGSCRCTVRDLTRYRRALSEPLLDRFELFCEVPRVDASDVIQATELPGSEMAFSIAAARTVQARRGYLNAVLSPDRLKEHVEMDSDMKALLAKAADSFGLSVRSLSGILKVSRTIADLAGEARVSIAHMQEALQYRRSAQNWP